MRILITICLAAFLWHDGFTKAQEPESYRAQTNNELRLQATETQTFRLLLVDYAMAYPEENAGVVLVFMEAGFEVDVRPYYPAMVERDASTYDAIVLMGGGDPGMSNQEVDLAINYVSRGKALILAVPSDGTYGNRRRTNPGVHDRYQFNTLLNRLNISLYAVNADHELSPVLNPVVQFEPATDHPVSQYLDKAVVARAGTRVLVGSGAEPLLVEPEALEPAEEVVPEPEEEPEYRIVRRTLRIQPADAIAGEDIELLLRGDRELRAQLYYRTRERPSPVDWETSRFKGKVEGVSETSDTLKVRLSGNRWGSEYALVDVPVGVIAAAFADREIREEIQSAADLESMRGDEETFGRMAVAAAGRTDRLNKGFVVVVDRDILTGLDRSRPPMGIGPADSQSLARFLNGLARYARSLVEEPQAWSPEHDYPVAQLPGNQKPDIQINNISVLTKLPERVQEAQSVSLTVSQSGSDPDEIVVALPPPEVIEIPGDSDSSEVVIVMSEVDVKADVVGSGATQRPITIKIAGEPGDVEIPVGDATVTIRIAASGESAVTSGADADAPLRGVWDFVLRRHEHIGSLAELLPNIGMDFLWTVAPAAGYTGGASLAGGVRFESWALPISNRLGGTSTDWYTGLSAAGAVDGDFEDALDARGDRVGLPSRFDMAYLNRDLFEPSRVIARHSRGQSALKGIVHDWEPRINRLFDAYAMTDAFDDLHFRYFTRHLVQTGLYHGEEFKSLMGLDRDERFEWLQKSGHLETYFSLQESNAERLGILYRQTLDEINPGLLHGAFVRSLRPNWYHLGFWRGAGTPDRPFLVFSYERPPAWYAQFLSNRGISARVIPVGLLGLLGGEEADDLLDRASDSGGYALERGIWLVTDPPEEAGLNAPTEDLTRDALLEAIRKANGE